MTSDFVKIHRYLASLYNGVENVHVISYHNLMMVDTHPPANTIVYVTPITSGRWKRDAQVFLGEGVTRKQEQLW